MKTEGSRTRKKMKKVESMKEKRETQKEQIPPELVAKAKAGDQAAFSELYQQTSTVLYRSIRSMVHDEDLAWDILQDSYLRAYKSLDQLENNAAFLSWLRRISVNVTATQMSKRLPTPFSSLSGEDSEQPELPDLSVDTQPELALDKKETSRLVQEILAQLSEEQHLIIGMRYYEELSVKEISELLRIAPGTVRAQLFRGRKRVETAVRALEKKGVKLYGLSPLPFFLTLLRQTEPAKDAARTARKAVLAKAAESGTAQAATITAYSSGRVLRGMLAKLALGILAVGVVGCGIWSCGKLLYRDVPAFPYQPSGTEAFLRPGPEESLEASGTYLEEQPPVTETPTPEPTEPEEPEAPDAPLSGTCGEHLSWSFDPNTGDLTMEGNGEMFSYDEESPAPWYPHHSVIERALLPNGLTSIGSNAFRDCDELVYVSFPDTLTSIEEEAFCQCESLYCGAFPEGLKEIGSGAFRGCANSAWCILPPELDTVGDGAFADGSGMEEIRIFNPDCTIGAELGDPARTTICGFPGSTAERYAEENGYAFDPIVETDPTEMAALLAQEQQERAELEAAYPDSRVPYYFCGTTHINGIIRIGTRFLAKVIRTTPVLATEDELEQARQTGEIVLQGKRWQFTESGDQLEVWLLELPEKQLGEDPQITIEDYKQQLLCPPYENDPELRGWIRSDSNQFYAVRQVEDRYSFDISAWVDYYNLEEVTDLGWIWLDGDTPVQSVFDELTLDAFIEVCPLTPGYVDVTVLTLGENGVLTVRYDSAGN